MRRFLCFCLFVILLVLCPAMRADEKPQDDPQRTRIVAAAKALADQSPVLQTALEKIEPVILIMPGGTLPSRLLRVEIRLRLMGQAEEAKLGTNTIRQLSQEFYKEIKDVEQALKDVENAMNFKVAPGAQPLGLRMLTVAEQLLLLGQAEQFKPKKDI